MAGKWGAWLDHATCGNDQCMVHKMKSEVIQGKYFEKTFNNMIGADYSPEELGNLRRVANGLG